MSRSCALDAFGKNLVDVEEERYNVESKRVEVPGDSKGPKC